MFRVFTLDFVVALKKLLRYWDGVILCRQTHEQPAAYLPNFTSRCIKLLHRTPPHLIMGCLLLFYPSQSTILYATILHQFVQGCRLMRLKRRLCSAAVYKHYYFIFFPLSYYLFNFLFHLSLLLLLFVYVSFITRRNFVCS